MTNDFTISSMYLFIHQQNDGGEYSAWLKNADSTFGNGDGILIKSEFEKYIAEELPMWNGLESKDARDTLDEFWYGLDINRSAKHIEGTRLNNLHALDDKEMERMERIIQEMEDYNELLTTLEGPDNLNQSNRIRWVEKVKAELKKSLDEWIRSGGDDGYDVVRAYEEIVIEITPEITIDDMQIDYSKIFAKYGFDLTKSSDKQALLPLIRDFINGQQAIIANYKEGFEFGTVDRIESFIEQYISEALYNNETEFYNNKPFIEGFKKGDINVNFPGKSDFQKQVAACDLYDQLLYDQDWSPLLATYGHNGEKYGKYDTVKLLRGYSDDELDSRSEDFISTRNDILTLFKNNDVVQKAGIQKYFDKMISNTEAQRVIKNDLDAAISQGKGEPGTSSEYILSDYCEDFRNDVEKILVNGVSGVSPNIKTDIVEALLGAEFNPKELDANWDKIELGILDLGEVELFRCEYNVDNSIPVDVTYKYETDLGIVFDANTPGAFQLHAPNTPGKGTVTITAFVEGVETSKIELPFTVAEYTINTSHYSNYATDKYTLYGAYTNNSYDGEDNIRNAAITVVNDEVGNLYNDLSKHNYDQAGLDYAKKRSKEFFQKLMYAISAHSGVDYGDWAATTTVTMNDGKKYNVNYNQESRYGVLNGGRADADYDGIEWKRGCQAGYRYAKIVLSNAEIFRWFNRFYNEYIDANSKD